MCSPIAKLLVVIVELQQGNTLSHDTEYDSNLLLEWSERGRSTVAALSL